jgi:hypothetical protein
LMERGKAANRKLGFGNTKTTRRPKEGMMAVAAISTSLPVVIDTEKSGSQDAVSPQSIFPFLKLPRELRDQARGKIVFRFFW